MNNGHLSDQSDHSVCYNYDLEWPEGGQEPDQDTPTLDTISQLSLAELPGCCFALTVQNVHPVSMANHC